MIGFKNNKGTTFTIWKTYSKKFAIKLENKNLPIDIHINLGQNELEDLIKKLISTKMGKDIRNSLHLAEENKYSNWEPYGHEDKDV